MMKMQDFNLMMHYHFLEIYCGLYNGLKSAKMYTDIESMVVMRKYWIDKLHPNLYHAIRVKIYRQYR